MSKKWSIRNKFKSDLDYHWTHCAQRLVSQWVFHCTEIFEIEADLKFDLKLDDPEANNRFVLQSVCTSRTHKYLQIWYGNNECCGKWTPSAAVSCRCCNPVTNVIKPQSQAAHFIRRTQDKLKRVYTCLIGWRTLLLAALIKGGVILIISWLHSAAFPMSKLIEFFNLFTRLCLSRYHQSFSILLHRVLLSDLLWNHGIWNKM